VCCQIHKSLSDYFLKSTCAISPKLYRKISTKSSCAYNRLIIQYNIILSELWPFNNFYSYTTNTISMKFYKIDWLLRSKSCPYWTGSLLEWFFGQLRPLNGKDVIKSCPCFSMLVQWILSHLWPFNNFYSLKYVRTTPLTPLMKFQWNFTGLIGRSSTCAWYTRLFLLDWF
jgi:hypothetical protein